MNTTILPHIVTDTTVTVVINGKTHQCERNQHVISELAEVLNGADPARLIGLMNPAVGLADKLDGSDVQVVGSRVTYKGHRIAPHLEKRLLDIASSGLPIDPWRRFVQRVYANPLQSAREELNLFMESGSLPITEDGCFLAYKRVNGNYTDCHTGTIDNSVGKVVEMPRHAVDADRSRLCSTGLHFCSQSYLKSFGGARVVVVKIDPADVVAIPADYNNAKGRTWRYEVVDEIDLTTDPEVAREWGVVVDQYVEDVEPIEEDLIDDDTLADLPDAPVVSPIAFSAPAPARRSWWAKAADRLGI